MFVVQTTRLLLLYVPLVSTRLVEYLDVTLRIDEIDRSVLHFYELTRVALSRGEIDWTSTYSFFIRKFSVT